MVGGYFTPFLNLYSIISLSKTCKSIYQLLSRPLVWQNLLSAYFSQSREEYPLEFQQSPKLLFRVHYVERREKKREADRKAQASRDNGYYH
jgi:hypothetical protein